MQDRLINLREIEKLLGVSTYTVYRMRKMDKFPKPANQESRIPLWKKSTIEVWFRSYKRIPCYIGK